ncbi:MAG: hypothetical protein IPM74_16895 [Crocinitomicaceae bacterium]|nr:hypothetical protein [Crocinitomicaceae bacterium]MBK8927524.1 hypothetical protein [Crocinitomicaceae bacterium]
MNQKLVLSRQNLTTYFQGEQFVRDTIAQINKDLGEFDIIEPSIEFYALHDKLRQLVIILAPVLDKLARHAGDQLAQFIYRVDVNETIFKQCMSEAQPYHHLAEQVIQRCAQKVYLRIKFSQK